MNATGAPTEVSRGREALLAVIGGTSRFGPDSPVFCPSTRGHLSRESHENRESSGKVQKEVATRSRVPESTRRTPDLAPQVWHRMKKRERSDAATRGKAIHDDPAVPPKTDAEKFRSVRFKVPVSGGCPFERCWESRQETSLSHAQGKTFPLFEHHVFVVLLAVSCLVSSRTLNPVLSINGEDAMLAADASVCLR